MQTLNFFPSPTQSSLADMPAARAQIERIMTAALRAVDPGEAVRRTMQRRGDHLLVAGREYDLTRFRRVRIVGIGKASVPMARAAASILASSLSDGVIVTKQGYLGDLDNLERIECLEAGHPFPDQRSIHCASRIASLLAEGQADDLLVVLISGGGSALVVAPAPGISLADFQTLTGALLASGADIQEINSLRKHLDMIKGGGLARLAAPATVITLILSDVIGDALDVIASGPTVPDPSRFRDAYQVLQRYTLLDQVPAAVVERLRNGMEGQIAETPKPGDPAFDRVDNIVVGSNVLAAQAALAQAQVEGFQAMLLTTFLQGEALHAGRFLGAILRQVATTGQPLARPTCLIAGGETTVTLSGGAGAHIDPDAAGGRNQEMALAAMRDMAGIPHVALVTLATDGGDGPTDAAGAIVTGESLTRARILGLNPEEYLARHDSYHLFTALGDLLKPGPTQTNVNDLAFVFAFETL